MQIPQDVTGTKGIDQHIFRIVQRGITAQHWIVGTFNHRLAGCRHLPAALVAFIGGIAVAYISGPTDMRREIMGFRHLNLLWSAPGLQSQSYPAVGP